MPWRFNPFTGNLDETDIPAFNGEVTLGSAASPSIFFSGDPNTGIYSPGTDQVAISTNGTQRINIEADGDINIDNGGVFYDATNNRLGVGTTSPGHPLVVKESSNICIELLKSNDTSILTIGEDGASGGRFNASNGALVFEEGGSEAMRIDTSGRLLVGTSSTSSESTILVQGNNNGSTLDGTLRFARGASSPTADSSLGKLDFGDSGHTTAARIQVLRDGGTWTSGSSQPTRLTFSTTADTAATPTERMRIASTGTVYTFVTGNAGNYFATSVAAGTAGTVLRVAHSATQNSVDGTVSFQVFSNGNVVNTNNSYGAISDIKLKENIVDANSQWSDIKAIQVRNYNFKEGQTHTQLGLIAQEVELVSPGLVSESPDRDEDGNDLGTVTKSVNYSVLYMKAVKALQEAMERIETLEAKVAALETP